MRLALLGGLIGAGGCDDPDDPATTGDEFEITIMAMPSSADRTAATDPHWHAAGFVTLRSDLRLLPGVHEIDVGDGQSYGYDVGVHVARPDHVFMWNSAMRCVRKVAARMIGGSLSRLRHFACRPCSVCDDKA